MTLRLCKDARSGAEGDGPTAPVEMVGPSQLRAIKAYAETRTAVLLPTIQS